MRRVPPTIFPTSAGALWRAARKGARTGDDPKAETRARKALEAMFRRPVVGLVDSGTSALTIAIRAALGGEPGLVAIPGYGCIDVPTAVMGAGGRAIGYDLDPAALAPERQSVEAALAHGARVLVVSHLFGHPVELAIWRRLCDERGVVLIEDAAQWAGARLEGHPLGQHGHFVILSLGRGKGLVGTGGGILLGGEACPQNMVMIDAPKDSGHWQRAAGAFAAIALARPRLYALPASIPSLRLGEMVFHPPHPIGPMSALSLRLLPDSLAHADADREKRMQHAERLAEAVERGGWARLPVTPTGAKAGVLRLPVILSGERVLPSDLGVLRPYPLALGRQVEVAAILPMDVPLPASESLARHLITLPVHARVGERDLTRLCAWLKTA